MEAGQSESRSCSALRVLQLLPDTPDAARRASYSHRVATCDLGVALDQTGFATPGVKIGLSPTTPIVAISRVVGSFLLRAASSLADVCNVRPSGRRTHPLGPRLRPTPASLTRFPLPFQPVLASGHAPRTRVRQDSVRNISSNGIASIDRNALTGTIGRKNGRWPHLPQRCGGVCLERVEPF